MHLIFFNLRQNKALLTIYLYNSIRIKKKELTVNVSKYLSSIIAVFIFIFIYELIIHGFLFNSLYRQTPQVWRSPEEMQANMPILMLFQLALSVVASFIFSQLFKEGGTWNGLVFGLYFGIIAAILNASWYLFLPVSTTLGWGWFITSLIEGLGIGLILGSIYRNRASD